MIEGIVGYSIVLLGIILSMFGASYAAWSYTQAQLDKPLFEHDSEETQLTALMREQNAWAILVSTLTFLISGLIVLGLVLAVSALDHDSERWRYAFIAALLITSIRSEIVQAILLWQAWSNKRHRIRLMQLREIREKRMSRKSDTKVLIVEDDDTLRKMLRVTLITEGYQVESAESGQEGITKAQEFTPHVVLWDVGLPDGSDASWMTPSLPTAAIIFMSGRTEIRDLPLGSTLLTKPVSRDSLVAMIESVMGRAKK